MISAVSRHHKQQTGLVPDLPKQLECSKFTNEILPDCDMMLFIVSLEIIYGGLSNSEQWM